MDKIINDLIISPNIMKLDLREIQEGIVSMAAVILLFSITIIVISILFKPYLVLEPRERDYIVLVSGFNIPFCFYYIIEGIRVSTIRELHEKYTSKFIIRTGIVTVLYIPHLIFMIVFLLMDVNVLEKVMVIVVVVLEIFIIGLIGRLILWKVRNLKRE